MTLNRSPPTLMTETGTSPSSTEAPSVPETFDGGQNHVALAALQVIQQEVEVHVLDFQFLAHAVGDGLSHGDVDTAVDHVAVGIGIHELVGSVVSTGAHHQSVICGGFSGLIAAGCQRQHHDSGQQHSNDLFHSNIPFLFINLFPKSLVLYPYLPMKGDLTFLPLLVLCIPSISMVSWHLFTTHLLLTI